VLSINLKKIVYSGTSYAKLEARCVADGWGTVLQAGRLRLWFPMVSMGFFFDVFLPDILWPWGRPSL